MTGEREPVIWLRPEQAPVGRPAERSRAEITAAAVELADLEGLDAVSMRRLAAALGTGAASLYRYVATRDDLLDLMTDSTAGEYRLPAPSGDWQADLLEIAHQARRIMRRHPWLPALVVTRPALGPYGTDLLEHLLDVLADHPAEAAHKLEAFAVLNALTALFVQNELAAADPGAQRQSSYLRHVATAGAHPRISALLADPQPERERTSSDRFATVLTRAVTGVLG
ncbi:TetR/AcrR family transcriptional regulator C-terminal domain-containing protein [Streptomyces sp. NBC_00963]|uniref:TetR/AcrR family transcriptional regulator C-terminal domain-containing protein n=1 Tax=Streptomyces sp. NBC_00963 TaxID=2903697 RepID=UPI003869E787|nr:TetR/AcrR family transcriptional regulator C-terminal domain-containing protein [Streptomyces sp. NBC_00963]